MPSNLKSQVLNTFKSRSTSIFHLETEIFDISTAWRERFAYQCYRGGSERERREVSLKLHEVLRAILFSEATFNERRELFALSVWFSLLRLPCHCLFIRSTKKVHSEFVRRQSRSCLLCFSEEYFEVEEQKKEEEEK